MARPRIRRTVARKPVPTLRVSTRLPSGAVVNNLMRRAELWTPAEMTTQAWYDSSDTATITESAGAVSQLDDKSGFDRHVAQISGSRQPVTGSRLVNNLNVLDYSGQKKLSSQAFAADLYPVDKKVFTIAFAVGDTNDTNILTYASSFTTNGDGFGGGGNGFETHLHTTPFGPFTFFCQAYCQDGTTLEETLSTNVRTDNQEGFGLYAMELDRVSSPTLKILKTWKSGGSGGIGGSSVKSDPDGFLPDIFVLGGHTRDGVAEDRYLDGCMGEVIVVHDISEDDRLRLEGYMAHRWGIEDKLLPDHPYAESPPLANNNVFDMDFPVIF